MSSRSRHRELRLFRGAFDEVTAPSRRRLLVTPNVDHLRLLDSSRSFRRAYASADTIVNDSRVLDRLIFRGEVLCAPGSEIAPERLKLLAAGTRVAIVGHMQRVEQWLRASFPDLVFLMLNPSMGYIRSPAERRAIGRILRTFGPDQIFVCTGAPQSEVFAAQLRKMPALHADILCCGSALNFLAGEKERAPVWTRRIGAEWAWRFLRERHTRLRYTADMLFLMKRVRILGALRRTRVGSFPEFRLVY